MNLSITSATLISRCRDSRPSAKSKAWTTSNSPPLAKSRLPSGETQIDEDDFVVAVAGVQHGQPLPAGVQGEVDGEVAERELPAGGLEGPAVGQQDGAAGLDAGQGARRGGVLGRRVVGAKGGEENGTREANEQGRADETAAHHDPPAG